MNDNKSIYGCVAAFHFKITINESNYCLKKNYEASKM